MANLVAEREWVVRVLGVSLTPGEQAPPIGPFEPVLPLWTAAKEEMDAGIGTLQRALLEDGDEYMHRIAEFGLNGATNRKSVGLVVALRELDARPTEASRAKAIDAVEEFRDFLQGSPLVGLIEDNPFGVAVPLRATLGKALDQIEGVLRV
jgi:hypothetical protein